MSTQSVCGETFCKNWTHIKEHMESGTIRIRKFNAPSLILLGL